MITAGIDVGSRTIKVVILKDGAVVGKALTATGFEQAESAAAALKTAAENAGIELAAIEQIVSTGAGRKAMEQANSHITEVGADAVGAVHLVPEARTVIDIGAEEGRGIKVSGEGKVLDFAVNEKCAAGAGSFTETMSRALEMSLDEFGKIALQSTKSIPMNAQCTVFAESEVVSLVHAETSKEDISRAVHDAIASRVSSMVRRVGLEQKVALIGGVAYNPGFVDSLTRALECEIIIPQDREYVGALGAALVAVERSKAN
jgi:benzoyl-CoA reductase subunit D